MGAGGRLVRGLVAAATVLAGAACTTSPGADQAAPPEGTGHLVANDLRTPPADGHFTAEAGAVSARLVARPDGCVTVLVDGVERVPVWPDGTDVAQDADDLDRYVVTLPDGTQLSATGSGGDRFTADGVVDDSTEPFSDPTGPPSLVATFLGFCAVEAAPILFADVGTFSPVR